MPAADAAGEHVGDAKRDQRQEQQQRRHDACTVMIEGLYPVVDGYRDRPGFARDAAAHHKHNPEFSERVREAEDDAGEDASTDRDFTSEGAFLVFPLAPTSQEMRYQYNFPRWLPLVS